MKALPLSSVPEIHIDLNTPVSPLLSMAAELSETTAKSHKRFSISKLDFYLDINDVVKGPKVGVSGLISDPTDGSVLDWGGEV